MQSLNSIFQRKARKRARNRRHDRSLMPKLNILVTLSIGTILFFAFIFVGQSFLFSDKGTRFLENAYLMLDDRMAVAGFAVDGVFVSGRKRVTADEVLKSLEVDRGKSILSLNLALARERLMRLNWVKDAVVERRLPNTIVVRMWEYTPFAIWQIKGDHILIDRDGAAITENNLKEFSDLPLVVGNGASKAASKLIDMISRQPFLFSEVEAAIRIGKRRWDLRFKNGVEVKLPEEGETEAWMRLIELVRQDDIFARDITAIDLRLGDPMVLQLTPSAAARRKESGKDT